MKYLLGKSVPLYTPRILFVAPNVADWLCTAIKYRVVFRVLALTGNNGAFQLSFHQATKTRIMHE